jgi:hypothetical protein
MNIKKYLNSYLFLGLLVSLSPNIIKADPYVSPTERAFTMNATRQELVYAYLNKCDENHHLIQDLGEARKHHYSLKDLLKSFGAGVFVGASVTVGAIYLCSIIFK